MNPVDALWGVADAVGKAVGDGFTLAAEVLCPRDHSCEERLRSWEAAAVAVEGEICDEAEACEGVDLLCTCGHPSGDHYRAGGLIDPCGKCDCLDLTYKSSAAVSAAADPSPTVPNAHSVVGDCPGSDSVILPTVEPGPQTSHPPSYQEAVSEAHPRNHVWLWEYDASGRSCKLCGYVDRSFPAPVVVAGESPREEDEQPSLGEPGCSCWVGRDPACPEHNDRAAEPVSFDDLAAHIMGDFTSGQECDPLTATLIDGLASLIAHSLLADFNITKK